MYAIVFPVPVIVPPSADHVTAWLLAPVTVAVRCTIAPGATLTLAGLIAIPTTFAAPIVTTAVALFVVSSRLTAVTLQLPGAAGAVNPTGFAVVLLRVPQLVFHSTDWFVVFATAAVSVVVPFTARLTVAGETLTTTGPGTATLAVAAFVVSATPVAVTVQFDISVGAVYFTVFAVPFDRLPQLAAQVTAVLVELFSLAVNVVLNPVGNVKVLGEMLTVGGGGTVILAVPYCDVSAWLIAFSTHVAPAAGAVYCTGFAVTFASVPQLAAHFTPRFAVFATVAVKLALPFTATVAVAGVTVTTTFGTTVTVACACFVGSATLAAVTVQTPGVSGAVNTIGFPGDAGNVPQLALQLTPVVVVPVTVAFTVTVLPANAVAVTGTTVTTTGVAAFAATEHGIQTAATNAAALNRCTKLRETSGITC